MKKLIFKTSLFVTPFFILFFINYFYYADDKGDLLRMGLIPDYYNYDHFEIFKSEYNRKVKITNISDIDLTKRNDFTVLTIGDSYSEQGNIGYQNYLADNSNIKILHFNRYLHENPIQTLTSIVNGNILNKIKIDYIILQNVERAIVKRALIVDKKIKLNNDDVSKLINLHKKKKTKIGKQKSEERFFSKQILSFPKNAIAYNFDDNAFISKVYKVQTNKILFSIPSKSLLFLKNDYEALKINNNISNINKLNNVLNEIADKLKSKKIKLIVLTSPDKFDYYYDEISNKSKYPKPIFFDYFETIDKHYIYINSKKNLKELSHSLKDIYYYDDSHWSPYAAKIIGKKIEQQIDQNKI